MSKGEKDMIPTNFVALVNSNPEKVDLLGKGCCKKTLLQFQVDEGEGEV